MTIEDGFFVKGPINLNRGLLQRNYMATKNAELVKRLKATGVIILGKTNTLLYCIERYMSTIGSFAFTTVFSGHHVVIMPIVRKQNGLPAGILVHSRKWTNKKLLEIAWYLEGFNSGFAIPDKLTIADLAH